MTELLEKFMDVLNFSTEIWEEFMGVPNWGTNSWCLD